MSWLSEYDIVYQYRCLDQHLTEVTLATKEEPSSSVQCPQCQGQAVYLGFKPNKIKQMAKIEYEKNGRKAVEIVHPDGTKTYLAKTKEVYMKTGRVEPQYSKEYAEHLRREGQEEMLRSAAAEKNRPPAKVSLADLPDGEYLSDGTNFTPKPD